MFPVADIQQSLWDDDVLDADDTHTPDDAGNDFQAAPTQLADVEVLETSGSWFGGTYPEDKPVVVASIKKLVDAGEYPAPLWG